MASPERKWLYEYCRCACDRERSTSVTQWKDVTEYFYTNTCHRSHKFCILGRRKGIKIISILYNNPMFVFIMNIFLLSFQLNSTCSHLKRLFDGVAKELLKSSTNLMLMALVVGFLILFAHRAHQIDLKLCGRPSSSQVRVQFDVWMGNNHKRHSCLFEEPSISISHSEIFSATAQNSNTFQKGQILFSNFLCYIFWFIFYNVLFIWG